MKEQKPDQLAEKSNKPGNLSPDFLKFLNRENMINRAWGMVDAQLEVDPTINIFEAFEEAADFLEQSLINESENITEK